MTGKAFTTVNRSVPLKDAYEKVTGTHPFPIGYAVPSMLFGKVLRSPHAHARIRRIDDARARALPGVVAVLTCADVPDREWLGLWYNYRGRVMNDVVRFVGDDVAAVAAVDERTAQEALCLIEVDYEVLPHVLDAEHALAPGAPRIRADGNAREPVVVEWGDWEKGLAHADVVVEGRTRNRSQDQATMSRNAPIASWTPDGVTLWTGTVTPSELRDTVANFLELPKSKVRVIALPTGPSLGKWWFNNIDMVAILLARKAKRPVKMLLSQEEVFTALKRRHEEATHGRLGVMRDGTMVSLHFEDVFENGAYGDKRQVSQTIPDLWPRIASARFEMRGATTNRVSSGCMRGVGDVTTNFGMEMLINRAAAAIGMDPVAFRRVNAVRTGDQVRTDRLRHSLRASNGPMPESIRVSSAALDECLRRGAEAIGWERHWKGWGVPSAVDGPRRRGVGVATAMHLCGIRYGGECSAMVRINADGSVNLVVSLGRQGTGNETTQCQIAAEELGIGLDRISLSCDDTAVTPWGQGSTASTSAHLTGTATRAAAADAKRRLLAIAAAALDAEPGDLEVEDGVVVARRPSNRRIPIWDLLAGPSTGFWEVAKHPCVVGTATVNVPADRVAKHMGAHFVLLDVDTDLGQVEILRYVAVHDSGRLINPAVCENQVSGGYYQGVGFSLIEELAHDEHGRVLNPGFENYKIYGCPDLPDPEILFVEEDDPVGPFGAKGLGEAPICVPPGAIAMAIHNATGAWVTETPMTPERILAAMGAI